ncbi:hypothetical protein MPRF_38480 [Mycolicibacterium parafortuitum]|uniref:Uncharacterized protein n=1 Tax=Mycolicibacterium parafortuitum TaxID=39692 RepID=A0A7I7U8K1_MYCPF|nr:hypothetical protein MPRF_38480 [Mycolicibacterium parafortuitum]
MGAITAATVTMTSRSTRSAQITRADTLTGPAGPTDLITCHPAGPRKPAGGVDGWRAGSPSREGIADECQMQAKCARTRPLGWPGG